MATEQQLNISSIQTKMRDLSLGNSDLAKKLDVSREIVSKWLSGKKFPRPLHLFQLAEALSLKFDEIMLPDSNAPVVAYRKNKNAKTKDEHIQTAQYMGENLKNLVPFLPFDISYKPATLLNPKNDFAYIQKEADKMRNTLKLKPHDVLEYQKILELFSSYHAILIPVLWGDKKKHDNALHIYLPDSSTTWIYLNLNSNQYDFKFWMIHEFAHILATDLRSDEGEDFADAFAAELLYPILQAEKDYAAIQSNPKKAIGILLNIAKKYEVSPVTIVMQINQYASLNKKEKLKVSIHPITANFYKSSKTIAEIIFKTNQPSAREYIDLSSKHFKTEIFKVIRSYYKQESFSSGYLQNIFNISFIDAKSLLDEVQHASK